MYMSTYMYEYLCICSHICMKADIHECVYMYVARHGSVYAYMFACKYVERMYECLCNDICIFVSMYTCVYECI